jgi:hypothetical protein
MMAHRGMQNSCNAMQLPGAHACKHPTIRAPPCACAAQLDANCRITVLRLSPTSWLAALGAVCTGLPVHLLWPCAYMSPNSGQPMLSAACVCDTALQLSGSAPDLDWPLVGAVCAGLPVRLLWPCVYMLQPQIASVLAHRRSLPRESACQDLVVF